MEATFPPQNKNQKKVVQNQWNMLSHTKLPQKPQNTSQIYLQMSYKENKMKMLWNKIMKHRTYNNAF